MDAELIGHVVRLLRKDYGRTQGQLAIEADLSTHWISKIERGGDVSWKAQVAALRALRLSSRAFTMLQQITGDDADAVRGWASAIVKDETRTLQYWQSIGVDAGDEVTGSIKEFASAIESVASAIKYLDDPSVSIADVARALVAVDYVDRLKYSATVALERQRSWNSTLEVQKLSARYNVTIFEATKRADFDARELRKDLAWLSELTVKISLPVEVSPAQTETIVVSYRHDGRLGVTHGTMLVVTSTVDDSPTVAGIGVDHRGHHLLHNGYAQDGTRPKQEFTILRTIATREGETS